MRLPQSQNKNVYTMCIVGNPACLTSEQGGVKSQPEPIMSRADNYMFEN